MTPLPTAVEQRVQQYVQRLKERGLLPSPEFERAFRIVPRHLLVESFYRFGGQTGSKPELVLLDHEHLEPSQLEELYAEKPLVTRVDPDNRPVSSSSMPGLVAEMLILLNLRPGLKILEIGTGTGYSAALMAELVGDQSLIYSVDIDADVIQQTGRLLAAAGYGEITLRATDGFEGLPEFAPFDRIVATVGCPDVSPRWTKQLAESGSMLLPLSHAGLTPLVRLGRSRNGLHGRLVGFSGFMAMRGEHAAPPPDAVRLEEAVRRAPQRPLPPELELRDLGEHYAFWFYLGVRDPQAFGLMPPDMSHIYGLWMPERGLVAINSRTNALHLAGSPDLVSMMRSYLEGWIDAGRPLPGECEFEFVPNSATSPRPDGARVIGTIDRRFHKQLVYTARAPST